METRPDSYAPGLTSFQPFGSWEAAVRWNQMAFEWMTTGWRQWLQLLTVLPATGPARDAAMTVAGATLEPAGQAEISSPVIPAQAGNQKARDARPSRANALGSRLRGNDKDRATATGERRGTAKRTAAKSKRPATTKRSTRSGSRTRG
jgi:hypothetical protein